MAQNKNLVAALIVILWMGVGVGVFIGHHMAKIRYHVPGGYGSMGDYYGQCYFEPYHTLEHSYKVDSGTIWQVRYVTDIDGDTIIALTQRFWKNTPEHKEYYPDNEN